MCTVDCHHQSACLNGVAPFRHTGRRWIAFKPKHVAKKQNVCFTDAAVFKWPQAVNTTAQYYCLELIPRSMFLSRRLNITGHYFILLLSRDEKTCWVITHTAGVATALALRLTTNRIATGSKSGTSEDHNTRARAHKSREKLRYEWAKRLQCSHHLTGYSILLPYSR